MTPSKKFVERYRSVGTPVDFIDSGLIAENVGRDLVGTEPTETSETVESGSGVLRNT